MTLSPPGTLETEGVDLKRMGSYPIGSCIIYSNGEQVNFQNGASVFLFRMHQPIEGSWKLRAEIETTAASQMDIWLSQEELNGHATLQPSEALMTVGGLASIDNVMCVGGYNQSDLVVLKSSGRGYTWDNRVRPYFVTHSYDITAPGSKNEWIKVSGTLPAASIMAGGAAALYSKFSAENILPYPNTLVMNNIILSQVKRFPTTTYPNPSEGYGIFDMKELERMLLKPYAETVRDETQHNSHM